MAMEERLEGGNVVNSSVFRYKINLRSLIIRLPRFRINNNLIVDSKFAFGHSAQIALHRDLAGDVRRKNLTLCGHEKIDVLDGVEEKLVSTVFDSFASPADLSRDLRGDLCLFFFGLWEERGLVWWKGEMWSGLIEKDEVKRLNHDFIVWESGFVSNRDLGLFFVHLLADLVYPLPHDPSYSTRRCAVSNLLANFAFSSRNPLILVASPSSRISSSTPESSPSTPPTPFPPHSPQS